MTDATYNNMPNPALAKHELPPRRDRIARSPRSAGSLLILIVTVLVIIALVGIAFLQRVRLDQAATARHERDYIDQVISGILSEISGQMTEDVFDNATNGRELYDYPWTKDVREMDAFFIDGSKVPGRVNGAGKLDSGDYISTHEDDRWLASTAPIYKSAAQPYRWLHLTNLTGIWLDLPAFGSGNTTPVERPIDGGPGNPEDSDTDIWVTDRAFTGNSSSLAYIPNNYEQRGVDTDLDGILDAQWQWAPRSVRQIAGREYVMAVRIVDLSAMLNVNTAVVGTANGFSPFSNATKPNVMRGYDPTGIDLSRLAKRVNYGNNSLINYSQPTLTSFGGNALLELQDLFDRRSLQNSASSPPLIPGSPALPLTATQARRLWDRQASIYGNFDRNYQSDSEFDLRKQAGVNDFYVNSPLETDMPKLMRQAANFDSGIWGIEASYEDVVGTTGSFESKISKWFYGTNPSNLTDTNTDAFDVNRRYFRGIRHMLTTASGTGIFSSKYSGGGSAIGIRRFALNRDFNGELTDGDPTTETNLREQIDAAFKLGLTPPDYYLGGVGSLANLNQLIDEYVAAIINYSDEDTVPQGYNAGGTTYYGLEKLPFLREVYVQALYADRDIDDGTGNPGSDGLYDTWEYFEADVGGDTRAMVIELGNPFSHRIHGIDPNPTDLNTEGLEDQVEIRVVEVGSGTLVGSWLFGPGTPDIEARNDSGDEDTLLVFSPPVDALDNTGAAGGPGTDMVTELNFPAGARTLELAPGTLTQNFSPGNGRTLEVQLWVDTPDGFVMYDKLTMHPDASLPTPIIKPTATAAPPVHQFAQASSARDSRGIRFVVDDGPASTDLENAIPNESTPVTAISADIDRFGQDDKSPAARVADYGGIYANFYNELQLPMADRPMRSLAELAWVHMFGFTNTQTFSERMSAIGPSGFNANRHFLLINPQDPDYDVLPSLGVPHAAVLMDIFTTVGPANDNRDNNNDDGDDTISTGFDEPFSTTDDLKYEQFVPGTINVNTATLPVLTLGSPLAESIDDIEALMRLIIAYRDQPTKQAAGYTDVLAPLTTDLNLRQSITTTTGVDRANPGIASIGELLFLDRGTFGVDSPFDIQRYANDADPALPDLVDLYPDPDENGSNAIDQGDDNEQRLARFQMLSQALSARSDTYVAYVVVRGYDQNNFNGLPVESAQFIAIFNRGSMEDKNDSVDIKFLRLQ